MIVLKRVLTKKDLANSFFNKLKQKNISSKEAAESMYLAQSHNYQMFLTFCKMVNFRLKFIQTKGGENMLTLYPISILVGVYIGWLSAWYCKDLYDHPKKKEQKKKAEPDTHKFNQFKHNRYL